METKKFVKTFKVVTSVFVLMVLLNSMKIIALISMNVKVVLCVMIMRFVSTQEGALNVFVLKDIKEKSLIRMAYMMAALILMNVVITAMTARKMRIVLT